MTETVQRSNVCSDLDRAMIATGVPDRHRTLKIDSDAVESLAQARTFHKLFKLLEEQDSLIALLGPNGTGKTQMAVEVIRLALRRKFLELQRDSEGYTVHHLQIVGTALYATPADLCRYVKESWERRWSENDALQKYTWPRLLVIDEFDKRTDTPWERNLFTNLIDARYGRKKATILIANSSVDDFQTLVGPSIADRMNETGGVLVCDWPSFRGAE